MEGMGPIRGRPKKVGFLVGGVDPIACEMICSKLICFTEDDLPMIRTAKQMGFGCCDMEQIEVVGDDYAGDVCEDFHPAEQVPIRFSFLRVCKSAGKQIALRVKSYT